MELVLVLQVVSIGPILAEVRISSILGPGCLSQSAPATPPPCPSHNPEPWRWVHLVTMETTRTAPSFSPISRRPDTETHHFRQKLSSSPSLSRSEFFTRSFRTTLELCHGSNIKVGSVRTWFWFRTMTCLCCFSLWTSAARSEPCACPRR